MSEKVKLGKWRDILFAMEIPFSEIVHRKKVFLPSGKSVTLSAILLDSERGRLTCGVSAEGFLPFSRVSPKENSWELRGEPEHHSEGDDWIGFRVENRKGKPRGRVTEIWFDDTLFHVTKFECRKKFFGFWESKRMFSAPDIFEVFPPKKLIVVEEENRVFRPAESVVSNFRKVPDVSPSGCTMGK